MLLGTSISGVLRARARWLARVEGLRAGMSERDLLAIDPDDVHLADKRHIASLSSIQRLFGVTGFRGRLAIRRLRVSEAKPWDVTSVRLDRFTGGPVDNALFKTRAFLGTMVDLGLGLDERPRDLPAAEREKDRRLFELLVADIRGNGLTIGHAGNKGFGWFRPWEAAA